MSDKLGISAIQNIYSQSSSSAKSANEMNSDLFMQLLVTQMQNQDPMGEGNDPSQQISQMATFAMVEQLEQMNSMMQMNSQLMLMNQGASLIGKEVTINLDDEETISGVVESVQIVGGTPLVKIGEDSYPVQSVVEIE